MNCPFKFAKQLQTLRFNSAGEIIQGSAAMEKKIVTEKNISTQADLIKGIIFWTSSDVAHPPQNTTCNKTKRSYI